MNSTDLYLSSKESTLVGRYITNHSIFGLIEDLGEKFEFCSIGKSVLDREIFGIKTGTGPAKILIWSQMHGNESTCTKSIFDFFNYWNSEEASFLRSKVTLYIVPILNPDGAELYTRENANGIDLNRDFIDISQPETRALLNVFDEFKPDYCFNMHDQRTIFGVEDSGLPATISFLAPSFNEHRHDNDCRSKAMEVIAVMNDSLQKIIPNHIARFDDSYNPNCAGDTFQKLGASTILFEAGHYPSDYQREKSRECIFIALVSAITYISDNVIVGKRNADYLNIPQNKIVFYDFVYRNVKINYDNIEIITNFASQYREELKDGNILFQAYIAEIGDLSNYLGHAEYDAASESYSDAFINKPQTGQEASFFLGDKKFVNGSISE